MPAFLEGVSPGEVPICGIHGLALEYDSDRDAFECPEGPRCARPE